MPIHKQIQGGETYLPFALSKLRQLAATAQSSGGNASQTYSVDGVQIRLWVVGDQQYLRMIAPTLLSWAFRTIDTGTVFSLILADPAGSKRYIEPVIQNYDAASYAVFNCLYPVGDGYAVRWQAEGPGFSQPVYSGDALDNYYPVMDALGNPNSYQYGDTTAPDGKQGLALTSDGCRFYAGTSGLGMSPMASHGLSLVPLGQFSGEAGVGEYKWMAMGRIRIGDQVETDDAGVPLGRYAPSMYVTGTREKIPYSVGPQLIPARNTGFSKLYAIGRGRAIMTLAYLREKATITPETTYLPDYDPVVLITPDFGVNWITLPAPFIAIRPSGAAPVGTLLCESGAASGGGVFKSVFVPMSKDGKTVLWLLPQCELSTGAGWQSNVTAILRSTDAGLTFTLVTTVPTQYYADAFWYMDRVFGEGCFWFYGSIDTSGAGTVFHRWVTYDSGSTWQRIETATGDFACTKPYINADEPGVLYAPHYTASPEEERLIKTDGQFLASTSGMQLVDDTFVLPPTVEYTSQRMAYIGGRDVIYPALPTLMRL